jgi:hypothetical protein
MGGGGGVVAGGDLLKQNSGAIIAGYKRSEAACGKYKAAGTNHDAGQASRQDKSRQDKTPDRAGQDRTGQDRTGQGYRTEQLSRSNRSQYESPRTL